MAKLFYTLEEAAQKLGKSTDEVMNMAKAGQLQELRDKDQVLFRRSAIDQLAGDSDAGSEINLAAIDLPSDGFGDDLKLEGSAELGLDDLKLDESAGIGLDDLKLDESAGIGLDDLKLDDEPSAPVAPIAASGADDSMMLDDLKLDDDEPAPARPAAPSRPATPSPAASASGIAARSAIGLADSSAGAARSSAGSSAGSRAGSRMMSGSGGPANSDDSMAMGMNAPVEAVGSGSALLDISSEESFFGAQMIEESMGGDDAAALPDGADDLFGGGDAQAGGDEVAPVTAAAGAAVTFGAPQLAESLDPKFSGFTAGAMVAAVAGLVGMGWAVTEMMVGNYTDVAKVIAENWMYVLGGVAGGVLVFGGIGFGIGKATA